MCSTKRAKIFENTSGKTSTIITQQPTPARIAHRFAAICGPSMPESMESGLKGLNFSRSGSGRFGTAVTTQQVARQAGEHHHTSKMGARGEGGVSHRYV